MGFSANISKFKVIASYTTTSLATKLGTGGIADNLPFAIIVSKRRGALKGGVIAQITLVICFVSLGSTGCSECIMMLQLMVTDGESSCLVMITSLTVVSLCTICDTVRLGYGIPITVLVAERRGAFKGSVITKITLVIRIISLCSTGCRKCLMMLQLMVTEGERSRLVMITSLAVVSLGTLGDTGRLGYGIPTAILMAERRGTLKGSVIAQITLVICFVSLGSTGCSECIMMLQLVVTEGERSRLVMITSLTVVSLGTLGDTGRLGYCVPVTILMTERRGASEGGVIANRTRIICIVTCGSTGGIKCLKML